MTNVQTITLAITIALISGIATFAWNNKTLSEQVEEHNIEVLENCLSKARSKTTSDEILRTAKNCNQDILTKITKPVETITGTHSTGNTVPPLGFQLIPQASATDVEKESKLKTKSDDLSDTIVNAENSIGQKIRTPFQIYEQVKHLGFREAPTVSIIGACKASSRDVQKCILVGLTLLYNEAGNKQNSKACIERRNCFGINAGKTVFKSYDDASERWVNTFDKWWYKAESPSFFYSEKGKLSPSRYCVSEESSNSYIGCPRGLSIASDKWSKLYPIIY